MFTCTYLTAYDRRAIEAIMQLVFCFGLRRKERGVRDRLIQDSKTENAEKTNLLTFTYVECPDE